MSNIPPIEDGYIDHVIKSSGPLKPSLNKTQGIELRALVKLLRDRLEGEIADHYVSNQAALSEKANIDQVVLKTTTVNGKPLSGDVIINKSDIGLGSVDNTPDLDKPLSSFAQAALALKADMVDVNERLSTKVDKVIGKQLSTEDFSSAEKDKLANIQAGATSNQNDSYLLAREHHTGTQGVETITGLRSELDGKVNQSEKGQGNGIATLDGSGKIPLGQLSEALLGSVNYQGNYNPATNTPTLPAAAGNKGKYYVVSVAGNQQGLELNIGDWIISNGNVWERVDNNNKVTSVNGRQGSVMIGKVDIGLANVDNTSDAAKPVSTAQQAALDVKANNNGSNATGLWGVDISGNANTVSLLNGTQIFSAINGSNLSTNTLNVNVFGRSAFSDSVSNGSADMSFHWQGQGGQPDWLWGGNAPGDMYVYNPNEFHVASAGRLRNIMVHDFDVPTGFGFLEGAGTNIPNQPQYGSWGQGIQFSTNNNPTYANQLVFNENGALSTRYKAGAGWSGWDRIITASQLGSGAYLNASVSSLGDNLVRRDASGDIFANAAHVFAVTESNNQTDYGTMAYLYGGMGDSYIRRYTFDHVKQQLGISSLSSLYQPIENQRLSNTNAVQFQSVFLNEYVSTPKIDLRGVSNPSFILGNGESIDIRPSSDVRFLSITNSDTPTVVIHAREGQVDMALLVSSAIQNTGRILTGTLSLSATPQNVADIDKILVGKLGSGDAYWASNNYFKNNVLGLGDAAYQNASGGDDAWTGSTVIKYNSAGFIRTASKNYPQNDIPTSILGSKNGDDFMWSFTPQALRGFLDYNGSQIYTSIDNRDGDLEVAKYMRWKQHGNGHVIFDASAGTSPSGTVIDRNKPQVGVDDVVNPVLMGWNGTNTYGVRVQQANNSSEWNGRQVNWNDNSVSSINNIVAIGHDGIVGLTSTSILANWLGFSLNNQWMTGAGAGDMNLLSTFESYLYTDGGINAPSPYSQVINIGVGTTSAIATQLASYYGHIDAYYLRSKYDTTNTWKPWRQIVTTDIGDLQNTLSRGNIAYDVAMGIDQYGGQPEPVISLAIGDSDTGFQRNGDGSTLYYSNGVALYQLNEAGGFRRFLGLNTDQTTVFANVITGNVNSLRIWNYYGNDTVNTYSWTDAATTTTSVEIVTRGSGDASQTESPTLAFHRYGSGGPQFRLDPTGTNVLYLESSGANSARDGRAYGGQANSYFTRFHIDGQLSVEGNLSLPSQSSNFFFRGNADSASYAGYNLGLKLWWGLGLTGYDDVTRGFYDARTGVWDVKTDFRIDGRSVTDMVTRLQSTSHNGVFYLENTWDGVHWWLRSNHGAPVKVGRADYADNAGTWSNQVWQEANKSGAVTFMTNNAGGWGYSTLAQVQESLGVTSAVGRDFNNFVFGTNSTATSETNDFNTLLKSGFYNGSQPGSTAPANSWHHLINSAHSGSTPTNIYNFQLSADFFSADLFYMRTILPAGPNPWRRITTDDRLANSAFTGMDVNPSGNTIVQRNTAGHAFATYFNSTDGTVEGFTPAALYAYNGTDGYLRKVNAGGIVNFLNINLQGVADRGDHEIWSNNNTSLGFNEASLIIREAQHGASSSFLAPRIGFHWGGVVASQISMDTDGWLKIINNPGNDYESLRLKNLGASGQVRADNIYTDGNVDSNSLRVRGGVNVNSEGAFITWNNGQFGGMSFINQKGGGTGGFKWQSSNTANGRNDLMQLEEDGQLYLYNNLIVGEGKTSSNIIMRDTDETGRTIHCNSNRIGFLNAGGGWGSYCDNTGNWFSDFSMVAQNITGSNLVTGGRVFSGYDSGVAGSVSANNWFRSSGQSGWYSSDYGGGIYMTDSTWVRIYASKGLWVDNSIVAGTGTNGGYANATYNQGHNNIWRLNSDPEYGLAYYQGMSGEDRIGFHFGSRNSPVFYVNTSGQVFAAGGFYDTSDKRIKTLSTEVFDTRSIKARTYYKNDKLETGYFAQEVEEVMPQAVKVGQDNLLTLNYTQVLVAKVANLEDDIKLLQNEINLLRQGI